MSTSSIWPLLCNNFEVSNPINDDQTTITKPKQQDVTLIVDWIQCLSTYIAVSCTKPECVADLKAYSNLMIKSQRHFQDFDWVLYDCQFRQKSYNNPPHKNDIPNIVAAMIKKVVPNFPVPCTQPHGSGKLSLELSESQYCWWLIC